jgi:hypothetical protein
MATGPAGALGFSQMRLAVLCCCAIVLFVSGCGSARLSQTAFRSRADAICHELGLQTGSAVSTKAALDKHIRRARAGIGELARLHPSSEDEHSYRDLIATLDRTMSLARTRFPALIAAKSPSSQEIERLARPLERDVRRAEGDARAIGLGACARALYGGSSRAQPQHGPTPQQVTSPTKRAFDQQMLAVSDHYTNALGRAEARFWKAFHHGHRAADKAWLTMARKQAGIYNEEASAIAHIKAPADARAEQQVIVDAYRVAAKQEAEFAVSYRHHGHSDLPEYLRIDWQSRLKAAVRRLETKGYALGDLEAIGWVTESSGNKIFKSNQP